MSNTRGTTVRAQIGRLVLLTAGLAPVVALVLIGLSRLQRDTPEWVYWEAELVFLISLKITYRGDGFPFLVGSLVFGFLSVRGSRKGERRPWSVRGFLLSIALLIQPGIQRGRLAVWLSWSHRDTAVASPGPSPPKSAAPPPCGCSRSGKSPSYEFPPIRRVTTPIDLVVWEGQAPGSALRPLGVDRQDHRLEATRSDSRPADSD